MEALHRRREVADEDQGRLGHAGEGAGDVRLLANGHEIGKGRMDHTVPVPIFRIRGNGIGRDNGGVVDRNYVDKAPFAFTGTIKKVVFDLKPHMSGGRRAGPPRACPTVALRSRDQRLAEEALVADDTDSPSFADVA